MTDRAPALPGAAPSANSREFLATLALLLAVIVALLALDLSLASVERAENLHHAADLYRDGRAQLDSGHASDAADLFSTAVSLERSNVAYMLALAQAMAAQGRADDAEQMLTALLERAQNDGAVNFTMARLLASSGRARDAASFYHRAIYGRWGSDSTAQRTAARMELIGLLAARGARAELMAELLALQADSTDSTALLTRVAPLYLRAGAPNRAAEAYRTLLRRVPDDLAARTGLGDAALAQGQFRTARAAFREAARLAPQDARVARRLRLADTLLTLDPTARGLSDAQRLIRSRALLARTVAAVDACPRGGAPPAARPARDSAIAALAKAGPSGAPAEAAERALDVASVLWHSRPPACAPDAPTSTDPLVLLHRSLAG